MCFRLCLSFFDVKSLCISSPVWLPSCSSNGRISLQMHLWLYLLTYWILKWGTTNKTGSTHPVEKVLFLGELGNLSGHTSYTSSALCSAAFALPSCGRCPSAARFGIKGFCSFQSVFQFSSISNETVALLIQKRELVWKPESRADGM